jgi:hypothetical protein
VKWFYVIPATADNFTQLSATEPLVVIATERKTLARMAVRSVATVVVVNAVALAEAVTVTAELPSGECPASNSTTYS